MPSKSDIHTSSVPELASLLKNRLASKMPCVLFLGSRASAFARENSKLTDLVMAFDPSPIQLGNLQDIEKFSRAYTILEQMKFPQSDLHAILEQAKKIVDPSPADHSLGHLVKLGYFDTVITTNVDNLLDICLDEVNLHEGTEYALFIRKRDDITTSLLKPLRHPTCQVVKLFGDLLSNRYIILDRWIDLESDGIMKNYLETTLARDTIIVGLDPVWDAGFDRILPLTGNSLWYVNDEHPKQVYPYLVKALRERKGRHIIGPDGNYNNFFRSLQWQLFPAMPPNYEITQNLIQEVNKLRKDVTNIHHKVDQIMAILSKISVDQGQKP